MKRHRVAYDPVKRALDFGAALIGLIVLSPVIGATAVAVAAKLGRPVIFQQQRPGLHGKVFTLYKFRSMLSVDAERRIESDIDRLTPFGRALRATSLDELPSLFNVLKGDMSIVGPRPLLVQYLERYTPEQSRRHDVRPGITGLAQVKGRNLLSWDEKFRLDGIYVDRRSPRLDMHILFSTIASVFSRKGISAAGEATMSEFGQQ